MLAKKILLVDDSVVARIFMIRHLESKYSEWEISQASNAKEALEILERDKYDLVTIDYNMPNTNGMELIDQIQKLGYDIKIVMLTANIQKPIREIAEKKGVLFLEKPISAEVVDKIINYETTK
jgi:CheY-like chemotaxis protein